MQMKVVKVVKKNDAGEWFGFHPGDYVKLARTTKGYSILGDPWSLSQMKF